MTKTKTKRDHRLSTPVATGILILVTLAVAAVIMLWPEVGQQERADTPAQFEGPRIVPPLPPALTDEQEPPAMARVAVVIDDLGQRLAPVERLLATGEAITFSVLPFLPHSVEVATQVHDAGREVILHLPMEPQDYPRMNPGKGGLFLSLSEEELRRCLEEDLLAVPSIRGVNNHMGSRFTEDAEMMEVVMDVLHGYGLFFLDSRTTPHSVVSLIAEEVGVPCVARDIFLDHDRDRLAVARQIDLLIDRALENGTAIAIGHPHSETLEALEEGLPRLRAAGVRIVPLSELVLSQEGRM